MSSIGFPLLLIPVAICNIITFLMPDLALSGPIPLFPLTLMSKDIWMVTLNDILVALSILLLWLEVMRAARPAPKYFTDHFLSLLVFGAAAAEFVMLPKFGNATFFLITLVAMVDFLAGVSLRARRPRRAVYAQAPEPVRDPAPRYEPAPVAPVPAPAPAAVPAATSVAEAVLTDRTEPKLEKIEPKLNVPVEAKPFEEKPFDAKAFESKPSEVQPVPPEIVAHTSPQIQSPDLQPGSGLSPDDKPKT